MSEKNAIIVTDNADNVTIAGNVIRTVGLSKDAAAVQIGAIVLQQSSNVTRVNISDNQIVTGFEYGAIRIQGEETRRVVVSDNVVSVDRLTGPNDFTAVPINAIFSTANRVTITGNTINHCTDGQVAGAGSAVMCAGNQNTISGNTIEMNPSTDSVLYPAIEIYGAQTACTGNAIGLDEQYSVAAIILQNTSSNCTCVSNTCGTVPSVSNLGTSNEVAHNV